MSSSIELAQPRAVVSFDHQCRLAESFARSALFGIKTADQALALMALCEAEGLHPATAVRDYHIISGKPALKADAMLARFQQAGGKVRWVEMTDERVSAEFSHPAGGTVLIDWDRRRAEVAGFWGKDNWRKFPRAMLRSRVVSEGIRTVFPGCVVGVYTPEEVQDFEPAPSAASNRSEPPRRSAEPPPYPDDDFAANFPRWRGVIESGRKTAEEIIRMVETKGRLSAEQQAAIRACEIVDGEEVAP